MRFRPAGLGIPGGAFFLILAPTSSVIPIVDLAFEHRMYLPLAPVVVAGTIASWELAQWWAGRKAGGGGSRLLAGIVAGLVIAGFATATVLRNRVYESEMSLWRDVAERAPHNGRAWASLARGILSAEGPTPKAMDFAERAVALEPNFAHAHNTLGMVLAAKGRLPAAIARFRTALGLDPNCANAHNNLGNALIASSPDEACEHYRAALAINPGYAEAHNNFGSLLAKQGKFSEAIEQYQEALRLRPGFTTARQNIRRAIEVQEKRKVK